MASRPPGRAGGAAAVRVQPPPPRPGVERSHRRPAPVRHPLRLRELPGQHGRDGRQSPGAGIPRQRAHSLPPRPGRESRRPPGAADRPRPAALLGRDRRTHASSPRGPARRLRRRPPRDSAGRPAAAGRDRAPPPPRRRVWRRRPGPRGLASAPRAGRGAGGAHAGSHRRRLRRRAAELPRAGPPRESPRLAPARSRGGTRRPRGSVPGAVAGPGGGAPRHPQGGRRLRPPGPRPPDATARLDAGRRAGPGADRGGQRLRPAAGRHCPASRSRARHPGHGRRRRPAPRERGAAREPGLRAVHVRVHRHAQGRDDPALGDREPHAVDAGRVPPGCRRRRPAEDAGGVRRLGLGVLGTAPGGWATRARATGRPPRRRHPRRGRGTPPRERAAGGADAAARPARRARPLRLLQPRARLQRRRAAGRGAARSLPGARGCGARQPVRAHRGHHRLGLLALRGGGEAGQRADRSPGARAARLRARSGPAAGPGGRSRRAVSRRGGPGARLPRPSGSDGGALRSRSVLQRGRGADVPDRRSRALRLRRQPALPAAPGRPGQGARPPGRAGRDRSRARGACRRAPGRGRAAWQRRSPAPRGVLGAARRAGAVAFRSSRSPSGAPARGAAAVGLRAAGHPAAHAERQGRPPRPARTGRGAARSRASVRARALGRGAGALSHLVRGPRPGLGGGPRQLLRAGRRFDPEPACRLASRTRGAEAHADAAVPPSHDRRVGGGGGRAAGSAEPSRGPSAGRCRSRPSNTGSSRAKARTSTTTTRPSCSSPLAP